jgi:nucleoside-diphosphate-sugar epimerase
MSKERFLVTGALGCIGAWTLKNLVEEGVEVFTLDLSKNIKRLQLLLPENKIRDVNFLQGDISKMEDVTRVFDAAKPTHIIHLAALQLPFCKANPSLGAAVNVVGTVNMFEALKMNGNPPIIYASSTAVYGTSEEYPEGKLGHDSTLKPRSHYGVYKQANEGTARVYWLENGLSSLGLRPYTVYGAGRDQGMTSTPTKAMLAAAIGKPYHISYGGRCAFQYGDDMARTFILAARSGYQGSEVFNVGGDSISVPEVISAIEEVAPEMRGKITYENIPLPFPEEVDNSELVKIIGELPNTSLLDGVRETVEHFRRAIANGIMKLDEAERILN